MAVSRETRRIVRQRANGLCEYCHADEQWQCIKFTMDHVVPQSDNGADTPENIALACRNCNERRGNRTAGKLAARGPSIPIFNPRTDEWNTHFAWSSDRLRIVGMTETGQVTLAMLDMNGDVPEREVIQIRILLLDHDLHPPDSDRVLSK